MISEAELRALQEDTLQLVERAVEGRPDDPDYLYRTHDLTGESVPYHIQYVVDKSAACRTLLGHQFLLRCIEKLQGHNFVPTWDSMVFKMEGAGAQIEWHRDAEPYNNPDVD